MADLFTPLQDDNLVLNPCQSLALRRMIEGLKADDSLYDACPEIVRRALADFLMPPYTSAETEIKALLDDREKSLALLEKFGARIQELEGKLSRRAA